ncbi:type IV pilus modification PilV family protein [Trichloromonas sp.]|uniref:type IV pilus modification PilV family protein n=1 Tax=Trichloromonas sp. TaxID=3069249 RepID=UPI002A439A21|nr:type II secretion system protein [Trichloromonas sp.]
MKNGQGYSLIELLVGLVIFTIATMAILTMVITAIRGNSKSQTITEARLLAQEKLEILQNTPVDTLINLDACPGNTDPKSDLVCTYECAPESCEFYRVLGPSDPEKPDHIWITVTSESHNFSLKRLVRE